MYKHVGFATKMLKGENLNQILCLLVRGMREVSLAISYIKFFNYFILYIKFSHDFKFGKFYGLTDMCFDKKIKFEVSIIYLIKKVLI